MVERPEKSDRIWTMAAAAGVLGLLSFAALFAFVIMPISQARHLGLSPWAAICRAAGLTREPAVAPEARFADAVPVSSLVYDPGLLNRLSRADEHGGARLVGQTCSVCHGENGVSENPGFPSLADQSSVALYKQLRDYKSGARVNPVMAAVVAPLSDSQMLAAAAYLSHDHAWAGLGPRWAVPDSVAIALVREGDPTRNLPACDACHGGHAGGPAETPRLYGQRQEYLRAQLQAYAAGGRRNDVYGRMRSVAKKLTPSEMAKLSEYYQGLR